MQKISGPTATVDNEFTGGDAGAAIPSTRVTAEWLNTIQRELVAIVLAAGLTLDANDDDQILTAITSLVVTTLPDASTTVKGKVELATNAETQTGSDSVRAVTPAGLASVTATETRAGLVELATTAEATTGSDTTRAVTPAGLKAAVDALIAAAPGALDTLDELAAALGDDANFASTVTTALAGKQPLDATLTAFAALTITQGSLIYGTGTDAFAVLAKDTNATRYLSNTGASNNPAWAQINLANGVTGRLPLANIVQGAALSVLGVTGNATADYAGIAAANDGEVLRRSGTALAFGAIALGSSNAVSGQLGPANGGTGVNNNAASTITISGSFGLTITLSAGTNVTLPTTGTLATLAGTEQLDNKTLAPSCYVQGKRPNNTQTGSYTLVLTDGGKCVVMNVAGANNLTVPPQASVAWLNDTEIDLASYGAGQTTVVAGAGVTIRSKGGNLKLTGQYSGATLKRLGSDEWLLIGDLAA